MERIPVMVSGVPGNMATRIMNALLKSELYHVTYVALTGMDTKIDRIRVKQGEEEFDVILIMPDQIDAQLGLELQRDFPGLIAIDYTHPNAANGNAEFYCNNNIPFVMGTTGGDRDLLKKTVESSRVPAVIAPNMSIPIVMLMDMFKFAAENYPNVLKGFIPVIEESHQATKADKSGTAKAIGKMLKQLGVNYHDEQQIRAIREPILQILKGVPKEALGGHGWHSYTLLSEEGNVRLGFEHNINGRDTYVDGTLKALDFIAGQVALGTKGKCFDMTDVMRAVH